MPYWFSRSYIEFQGHTAKKSSILTQIGRFRTVTAVWIHQGLWNDTQSLKQHRRGALLFFKVIRQISRTLGAKKSSILTQIGRFWTVTPVCIHQWLWNDTQSLKKHRHGGTTEEGNCSYLLPRAAAAGSIKEAQIQAKYAKFPWMKSRGFLCIEWMGRDHSWMQIMGT